MAVGAGPEHDLAGEPVDPGAVDAPEPVQREPGDQGEDREAGEQDDHPGGRLLGDAPGGGRDLDGDGPGERHEESRGEPEPGGQPTARLVRAGEHGAAPSGSGGAYFPYRKVCSQLSTFGK